MPGAAARTGYETPATGPAKSSELHGRLRPVFECGPPVSRHVFPALHGSENFGGPYAAAPTGCATAAVKASAANRMSKRASMTPPTTPKHATGRWGVRSVLLFIFFPPRNMLRPVAPTQQPTFVLLPDALGGPRSTRKSQPGIANDVAATLHSVVDEAGLSDGPTKSGGTHPCVLLSRASVCSPAP